MNLYPAMLLIAGLALPTVSAAAEARIEPTYASLSQSFKTPEWLQDAKFGIYTHWGPVTHAIRYHTEGNFGWYGRFMHKEGHPAQAYHRKHYGDPKEVTYTDLIPGFTAKNFDPEEWADLIAGAGAKFAGPISIHHDNFAMWDSDITRWNAADMGPNRDIVGELEKAYRKRGLKFLGAFHHGFTYHYYEFARRPGYEGHDPAFADLYGPVDARDSNARFSPQDWQERWLALVNEFNAKYRPDLIYFDFGLGWQNEDIQYRMYADYYNAARANGQEVTVLQKDRAPRLRAISTMDLERGRMNQLTDYTWTTDTSPGSWFYHANPTMNDANTMIDMLVDIVSKNGVMILNVAPDYEGSIPPEYRAMLKAFGTWLRTNGEGIYETRPWPVYGEGKVVNPESHFKVENSKARTEATYGAEDIRYTRSKDGKTVYAFLLGWPEHRQVTFRALSAKGKGHVSLLGGGSLPHSVGPDGTITVQFPDERSGEFAHGVRFAGFEIEPHPEGHFTLPSTQRIPAGKAAVHGWSMQQSDDRIHNWTAWWGTSHWLFVADAKEQAYDLRCRLTNRDENSELRLIVFSDKGERHEWSLKPPRTGREPEFVTLGQVKLKNDGVFHTVIGSHPDKLTRNAIDIYELQVAPAPNREE